MSVVGREQFCVMLFDACRKKLKMIWGGFERERIKPCHSGWPKLEVSKHVAWLSLRIVTATKTLLSECNHAVHPIWLQCTQWKRLQNSSLVGVRHTRIIASEFQGFSEANREASKADQSEILYVKCIVILFRLHRGVNIQISESPFTIRESQRKALHFLSSTHR